MIVRRNQDIPYLPPGCGFLPAESTWLWAVVGSGVVVTFFDKRRRKGGMTHYCRPYREANRPSTAYYAAPAIVSLVKMLIQNGSHKIDLEAQMYGGAKSPFHNNYARGLHEQNVKIGFELLHTLEIQVSGVDVGGTRGRKIGFNPQTGEVAIAKINEIRNSDWYPPLPM